MRKSVSNQPAPIHVGADRAILAARHALTTSHLSKYLLIGIVNSILGYLLIAGLMLIGMSPELSNFLVYFFGIQASYALNRRYNFKSKKRHRDDLPRFLATMAIAYLLNLAALVILYRWLGVNAYVSQLASGAVYVAVGYVLSRVWVFGVSK